MTPELFLEQKDVVPLTRALNQFAIRVNVASDRQDILEGAGVDIALLSNLRLDTQPNRLCKWETITLTTTSVLMRVHLVRQFLIGIGN
jgi:hypothetical protein